MAVVAAIGTTALAFGLSLALGLVGVFLAAIIAAVALGFAISAMFGAEIKRSFLIGVLFMVVHVGASFGFQAILGR